MKLAYCSHCGMPVEFDTRRRTFTMDYEGRRYAYSARQAVCKRCGSNATYPPYQEEAGIAFNNAVRDSEGLVSLDVVREIPKRYAIGKRPLSRVLGLGEHTYSQLMNGQTPSKEHSLLIQRVYDDPLYYRSLLETGKDLVGQSSYERSMRALEAYLRNDYSNAYRLYELARIFVFKAGGDITKTALQKLVYYTQGFSAAMLGTRCVDTTPRAWAMGPVYGQLWFEYDSSVTGYFAYHEGEDCPSPFTAEEDEIIDAVWQSFGCYSGSALSKMTHKETPWLAARRRGNACEGESSSESIRQEDMDSFFKGVVEKYSMVDATDISRYAGAAFQESLQ